MSGVNGLGLRAANSLLEIKGVTSHYGRIQALHGVDLQVREGQIVALVGANGAGKTTLLRAVSGVKTITAGTVQFRHQDISRQPADWRVRNGISQVPEGRQVFGPMSVEDNLLLGAFTRDKHEAHESLARMYALFPSLLSKRAVPAGNLSGGQQQMLAMGRALMARPALLLLDEPSMGLAPLIVQEIFRLIRDLRHQGVTILIVEQNAHAALTIADHAYVLETGRVVLSGPGPELLQDPGIRAAYLGDPGHSGAVA
ncbi:MAG: ABC transporter ATP-binding protein [Burkholderiales bacterium]|nr:MAG: ABC transporter ATP-binding protein [Burkholderiales bacterium]